jgi:DNA-binding CsgD family transcriptional regulator
MATLGAAESASPTQLLDVVVAAFDWLNTGFLITSGSGQLLFANESAEELLRARDGLHADESGQVRTGPADSARSIDGASAFGTLLAEARRNSGLIVSILRPSGKLPLTLTMRPSPAEPGPADADDDRVLILVHDPERPVQVGYCELRDLYGLTVTEARITNLMMQGKSIEECTALLGIRRSTVKMHLRNLYGKTGVQRQSELVSLMFKSFGNIRSSQPKWPHGEKRVQANQTTAC